MPGVPGGWPFFDGRGAPVEDIFDTVVPENFFYVYCMRSRDKPRKSGRVSNPVGRNLVYRGTSLLRKRIRRGPYRRPIPWVLGGSQGGGGFVMGEVPLYRNMALQGCVLFH